MKKILFLIPSIVGGGAERVMVTLANGLSKKYDVEILALTNTESFYAVDDTVKISGIGCSVNKKNAITKFFTRFRSAFKGFFGIKRAIKEKKPDVVIAFLNPTSAPLMLLKTFSRLKCKTIVSERADPNERGFLYRLFERNFFPKADVIVCQSKKAAEFFKEKHKNKIVVIPNPICATAIPPFYEGERTKRIVGVGRLAAKAPAEVFFHGKAGVVSVHGKAYDLCLFAFGGEASAQQIALRALAAAVQTVYGDQNCHYCILSSLLTTISRN